MNLTVSGPIWLFTTFMWLKSLYFFRPIRTILWSLPTLILSKTYFSSKLQTGIMIQSIELFDTGEEVLITLVSGYSFKLKISNIRKPDLALVGATMLNYSRVGWNFIPIEAANKIFMIDSDGKRFAFKC